MIGYLRGEVMDCADGKLLLSTGAVGYQVSLVLGPSHLGFAAGAPVELFIHTHVREDALDLYGFITKSDKDLFLTLLTVTGIGPKGAQGILSKVESPELIQAILNGDKDALTALPGIGKKTAERVVVELSDSVRKKVEAGIFLGKSGALHSKPTRATGAVSKDYTLVREAKEALLGLGYRENEIGSLLNRVMAESDPQPKQVEDLIKSALRALA